MQIRKLLPADAAEYHALRIVSEQEFPEYVGFNAERELAAGADGIAELLAGYESEGTLVWGAFEGDTLLGTAVLSRRLSPKYQHKAFAWGMYVQQDRRGTGIAEAILEAAIDWANNHPEVIAITLQVTTSNDRARKFYERYGFKLFGTEANSLFAAGEYHGVHYMELETKA